MTLEELVAKQEISEPLHRYCRGIDRFDWDLVRSCYHDAKATSPTDTPTRSASGSPAARPWSSVAPVVPLLQR
jgi:hypothetical protein